MERKRSLIGPSLRERRRSNLHLPKTRGPKVRGLVVTRAAAFTGQQGFQARDVVRLAGEHAHTHTHTREAVGSVAGEGRDVRGGETIVRNLDKPKDTGEAKWMRREEKNVDERDRGKEFGWSRGYLTTVAVTGRRADGQGERVK